MTRDNDNETALILSEVRALSTGFAGLSRQFDRMDQRLIEVEHQVIQVKQDLSGVKQALGKIQQDTELIPSIVAAVSEQSSDLDNHERRITTLEKATA